MSTTTTKEINCLVLGASGYTGAEFLRLLAGHPVFRLRAAVADRKAGMRLGAVFPHLSHLDVTLQKLDEVDLDGIDLVFAALPHATSQKIISELPERLRIVDVSADFRLEDPAEYERWYGGAHLAPALQETAVYGLTEIYRDAIRDARLVASTGCNAATGLLALIPLLRAGVIAPDPIIIDAKCGVSGAGRGLKEAMLYCEAADGAQAYGLGGHRHLSEFDQELTKAAGAPVRATFIPHLCSHSRGILETIYVHGEADDIRAAWARAYGDEPFVRLLAEGASPSTRHVRGSNFIDLGVVPDRASGRSIVLSALDNLTKGSSGQAIQNANVMFGLPETAGLDAPPSFP